MYMNITRKIYRFIAVVIIFVVSLPLVISCKGDPKSIVKTEAVSFAKEGELKFFKGASDSLITTLDIEIADTEYETQTGLMYRDELGEDEGMLFIFPETAMHSFYMKNTKITLDLLFIDENLRIAHIVQNAQPMDETGLSSQVPVDHVLEVNGGYAARWKLQTGDRIRYQKVER